MDRLRNEKFDFALTEFYDICGLAIFEKIGITRFAAFAPFPMMHFMTENFGVPAMSSFIPGKLLKRLILSNIFRFEYGVYARHVVFNAISEFL
jgi:hypothetical protein